MPPAAQSFSFEGLNSSTDGKEHLSEPTYVSATDGTKLAVREYLPKSSRIKAILVFLHGGGAHSAAGYQGMAYGMAQDYGIAVYTPDLRGHGASEGPKGDAPSPRQVWEDVVSILKFARQKNLDSLVPLFLGGHSSGGGLVINFATWMRTTLESADLIPKLSGFLLLSPELGHLSGTARPGRIDFAKVNVLAFIVNGVSGGAWLGHNPAVKFNYPPEILKEDPGMCAYNTVHMANAISPESPREQVQAMESDHFPLGLWVGQEDELFDATKVAEYAKDSCILQDETHLGILINAHQSLGPWILRHI